MREKLTRRQALGLQRLHDAGELPTDGSEVTIYNGQRVLVPFTNLWHDAGKLADYIERMGDPNSEAIARLRRTGTAASKGRQGDFIRYDFADRIATEAGVSLSLYELKHGDPIFSRTPPQVQS